MTFYISKKARDYGLLNVNSLREYDFKLNESGLVEVAQSYVEKLKTNLGLYGFQISVLKRESKNLSDQDFSNELMNKRLPLILLPDGTIAAHDLFFHVHSISWLHENGHSDLINAISLIIQQEGDEREKLVDSLFYEVGTSREGFLLLRDSRGSLIDILDIFINSPLSIEIQSLSKDDQSYLIERYEKNRKEIYPYLVEEIAVEDREFFHYSCLNCLNYEKFEPRFDHVEKCTNCSSQDIKFQAGYPKTQKAVVLENAKVEALHNNFSENYHYNYVKFDPITLFPEPSQMDYVDTSKIDLSPGLSKKFLEAVSKGQSGVALFWERSVVSAHVRKVIEQERINSPSTFNEEVWQRRAQFVLRMSDSFSASKTVAVIDNPVPKEIVSLKYGRSLLCDNNENSAKVS